MFSVVTEHEEASLVDIMNALTFDPEKGEKFDANFISVLHTSKEYFEYYVQRLLGHPYESEGTRKLWTPYINN